MAAGVSLLLAIVVGVVMANSVVHPNAAVSAFFGIPVVVGGLGAVATGIVFIVKIATKKKKLISGLLCAGFAGLFLFSTTLGVLTSPATWCKHEFEVVSEQPATCTEDGGIVLVCALCDTRQTEKIKATGHDMIEVSRSESEIVTQCSVCGYEEMVVVEAGVSSKPVPSQPQPAISSEAPPSQTPDSPYSVEFLAACADIGLDTGKITDWEQIDDWANGERFRFTYLGQTVVAYINADETVEGINVGSVHVYQKGYEPYNIDDYIVDVDTAEALIPYAEDVVKLALNYPSTADFPLFGWGFGRERNVYILTNTVTAQNAFGIKEKMPFTVMFDLSIEGKADCVYFKLGATVVEDDRAPAPERQRVASEGARQPGTPDGVIRLIDGELGEYGQYDTRYPEYVDFYIPIGTYSVEGNAKNSIVMVIDDATNEEVSRVTISADQGGKIIVAAGQHIELTEYSDVTLTLIR
jgi:hypothetical protein